MVCNFWVFFLSHLDGGNIRKEKNKLVGNLMDFGHYDQESQKATQLKNEGERLYNQDKYDDFEQFLNVLQKMNSRIAGFLV